jgi:hypothetical protein
MVYTGIGYVSMVSDTFLSLTIYISVEMRAVMRKILRMIMMKAMRKKHRRILRAIMLMTLNFKYEEQHLVPNRFVLNISYYIR